MLVLAVDVGDTDSDRAGEVELCAGSWVPGLPPADLYDGDLVVRLTQLEGAAYPLPRDHAVGVGMLLARRGRWQLVGQWCALDERWPWLVAPTAAAVMGLHLDAVGTHTQELASPAETSVPLRWAGGGVGDLLDAGLVKAGDALVWNRRNHGVRHTARVRADGTLILAYGRAHANPSGAATALGATSRTGGAHSGGSPTGAPWPNCEPNCGRGAGAEPPTPYSSADSRRPDLPRGGTCRRAGSGLPGGGLHDTL